MIINNYYRRAGNNTLTLQIVNALYIPLAGIVPSCPDIVELASPMVSSTDPSLGATAGGESVNVSFQLNSVLPVMCTGTSVISNLEHGQLCSN